LGDSIGEMIMSKRGRKKEYRIGIVGSAGTGKAEFAKLIAAKMDLPYITSKNLVAELLKKDCYDYSSGTQVERFLAQGQRQERILNYLVHEEKKRKRFVSDRPMMDLSAYAVTERYLSDPVSVRNMCNKCLKHAKKTYTHIIVCPWEDDKPLEDNGLRTLNPWYQFIIHSLTLEFVRMWGGLHYLVSSVKDEERFQEVKEWLSEE
jgi:adenylate kinase family enzyme